MQLIYEKYLEIADFAILANLTTVFLMLITVFSQEKHISERLLSLCSPFDLCSQMSFAWLSLQLLSPCFELRHSNVKQILTMSHKTCASRKAMHLQVANDGAICKIKSAVNVNYKPLHIYMHRSRKVLKKSSGMHGFNQWAKYFTYFKSLFL